MTAAPTGADDAERPGPVPGIPAPSIEAPSTGSIETIPSEDRADVVANDGIPPNPEDYRGKQR